LLIAAAAEREVNVWGEFLAIAVHQESRTVWIAQGDYTGERIEIKGSTATSAVALCEKAAHSMTTVRRHRGGVTGSIPVAPTISVRP